MVYINTIKYKKEGRFANLIDRNPYIPLVYKYTLKVDDKMMTENERKVLRFLLANFSEDYSINEISRQCNLVPNGAFKILKKFEKKNITAPKKVANIKSYKLNFDSPEAIKILELVLMPEYKEKRIRYRHDDLKSLQETAQMCIIFGSYVTQKENPNDIDILFVFKKEDYNKYQSLLQRVKLIIPLKVHDVIQTKGDFVKNIRTDLSKKIIRNGEVLWGQEFLVRLIKNVAERKA